MKSYRTLKDTSTRKIPEKMFDEQLLSIFKFNLLLFKIYLQFMEKNNKISIFIMIKKKSKKNTKVV